MGDQLLCGLFHCECGQKHTVSTKCITFILYYLLAVQFVEVNELCIDTENMSDGYGTTGETLPIGNNQN